MKAIKVQLWIAAVCLVVSCFVGFLAGTEYQHAQSLRVEEYEVPGLLIDKGIYEFAVSEESAKASPDPLVLAHLESQLALIKHDIAKAGGAK